MRPPLAVHSDVLLHVDSRAPGRSRPEHHGGVIRFRLSHDDGDGLMYFEVRIFDTPEAMRAHYLRAPNLGAREAEHEDGWIEDAAALTAPRTEIAVYADGSEANKPRIGFILFSLESVTTRVVSHELVHAALSYYRERRHRLGQPDVANFGAQVKWREEAFAHIYCSLMGSMSRKLHELGVWA